MDYSKMIINPDEQDDQILGDPVFQLMFRDLNKHTEAKRKIKAGKGDLPLIRYIALIYDKHSPLQRFSVAIRKDKAVDISGLENKLEAILEMSDDRAICFAHLYLKYQNDKAWATLKTNEELFWQYQFALIKDDKGLKDLETKNKLAINLGLTEERIEKLEAKIIGDNTAGQERIFSFSVEDYAMDLKLASENV